MHIEYYVIQQILFQNGAEV